MLKSLAYAGLVSTALIGSAALGQSMGDTNQAPAAPSKPVENQTGGAAALGQTTGDTNPAPAATATAAPSKSVENQAQGGSSFVKQQATDQWRAPKLVGVSVYCPDDKKLGSIDDVLVDHNGAVQIIVIGVGGFLGLGTKDVAVPFKEMRWRTEGRVVAAANPPPANSLASTDKPSAPPPSRKTDPAATEANQGYPDKAILNVTLAQLKAAPDFQYAPSPLAAAD
jgi:PRC-barrel domain